MSCKKLMKWSIHKLTTAIHSMAFNSKIKHIFNLKFEVQKYRENIIFRSQWKHPSIFWKIINKYQVISETTNISDRGRPPDLTMHKLKWLKKDSSWRKKRKLWLLPNWQCSQKDTDVVPFIGICGVRRCRDEVEGCPRRWYHTWTDDRSPMKTIGAADAGGVEDDVNGYRPFLLGPGKGSSSTDGPVW